MTLKQRLKKILIWFIGTLFFLIGSASVISYIYQDKIIRFVTDELGSQIQGTVKIEKIDLSFLSSFPNVAIQLHSVVALSTNSFKKTDFPEQNTDTALTAELIGLAFNIFDFLREDFIVQEIKLQNAHVAVFIDTKGNNNWMFIKDSEQNTEQNSFVDLSEIIVKETHVKYYDALTNIQEESFFSRANISGDITTDGFNLQVSTHMLHKNLQIDSFSYIPNTQFKTDFSIQKKGNTLHLHKISLSDSDFNALISGTIALHTNTLNLQFSSEISNIHDFTKKISSDISERIQEYALQGIIQISGTIQGILNSKNSPALSTQYSIENGSFIYNSEKFTFASKGSIASNSITKLSHYSLYKASVACAYKQNEFDGTISFLNFENPELEIDGKLYCNLESIHDFIDTEGYKISGKSWGNIYWKGKLSAWNSINESFFTSTKSKISCNLEAISIESPPESPYTFSNISGKVHADNYTITIDSLTGIVHDSPFEISGTVSNFITSFFIPQQKVHYDFTTAIESIQADPFVTHYESLPESTNTTEHLGIIYLQTNHCEYDIYNAQNITCEIHFSNNEYAIKNWQLHTMNGTSSGNTIFKYNTDNTILCTGTANLKQVSSKELFKTFNSFDQTFLTTEQISGDITSIIQYNILFDSNWNVLYPSMNVIADVRISDGSISDFEPFIEIGKKLKVEEFKTVKFKELKNTIQITQDTLFIPKMDISSNAFEMVIGGKHSLSNNFTYSMIINMKSTLSNRFKKNNKIEDFGEIEQNSDGDLRIPLKLKGNTDVFSIDYDFKTQVQQVKESIDKQRDDWREILQKNDTNGEQKEEKSIQTDFQIQYD